MLKSTVIYTVCHEGRKGGREETGTEQDENEARLRVPDPFNQRDSAPVDT